MLCSFTTFQPYFPNSSRFREVGSLIAATHALSFYSLTLQHGVPFQPVSIRVSKDPIRLLDKVLEQNPRSYTKLDDLISIGNNLVSAGLQSASQNEGATEPEKPAKDTERRVTFMAVEAALRENDFETAYSYIMNRLTPSDTDIKAPSDVRPSTPTPTSGDKSSTLIGIRCRLPQPEDDMSWRAAFLAGRYRPSSSSPHTRAEHQAEQAFDDLADKRVSTASLPGHFAAHDGQPPLVLNQQRREIGRTTAGKSVTGEAEAPMSMFDLTRSAASALSRNAFPLTSRTDPSSTSAGPRSSGSHSTGDSSTSPRASLDGQPRVRRRDMVASAVSGSLVSGLGWVLGATPADAQAQQREREQGEE
nr:hypothetical protein CFP56_69178 [Quercus suber]